MKILLNKILIASIALFFMVVILSCEEEDKEAGPQFTSPEISLVTPLEALIGDEVVITGENLKDVVSVKFGSIEAESFTINGNELSAIVPNGLEAGETTITVFYKGASGNNLGPSSNIEFIVLYPPVITSTFPTEAKPGFEVEISGSYLANVTSIKFGEYSVSGFEATQTKIVTAVPADAVAGDVQLEITTPGGVATIDFTILERTPEIYSFDPETGGYTGDPISVSGLFFFDVQSVFIGDFEVTDYTVVDDSEITFDIPLGAESNPVTVTTLLGSVTSAANLTIIEYPYVIYDEELHKGVENWAWGGTDDFANSTVANSGSVSYERTYNDGWSGIQLHHGSLLLDPYTELKFSIYGGPGTTGKVLNCNIGWGPNVAVTVTEGEWTDYSISLADLGGPATLGELIFQDDANTSPATPYTVYLDNIRLE